MRTSEEIYHRVRWDPRFDPALFVFGVEQRAAAVKRVPVARFVPGGEIPWHRVLFVEAEGRLVWDRASGLDLVDESGLGRARTPRLLRAPFFTATTPHVWHPVDGWRPGESGHEGVGANAQGTAGASAPAVADHIRVLTWNTLWDRYDSDRINTPRRRVLLLAALERAGADVIALQEVEADLLAMLASAEWVRAGYTLNIVPRGNEVESSGLLLLSRLPVREAGVHALGPHKALAAVTVETGSGPLVVAATHLSSDHSRDGAVRRRGELSRIAEGLAAVDGELVLVGDFNDGGDRPAVALGLADTWSLVHGPEDKTPTFDPADNPLAALSSLSGRASRIDRVLMRTGQVRPTAAALLGTVPDQDGLYASDHFGVSVELELAASTLPGEAARSADVLEFTSTARTAVAWIPPQELWPVIRDMRREHDPQIHRWPPHVNVLFGFAPESEFDRAVPLLAEAAARIQPFPVRLDGVHTFGHREDATVWLDPAGGAEKQWADLHRALSDRFPQRGKRPEGFTPHLTLGRARDPRRAAAECAARLTPMTAQVGELVVLSRRGEEPMRPRAVITLGTGELRWSAETAADDTPVGDMAANGAADTLLEALVEPVPSRDALAARTAQDVAKAVVTAAETTATTTMTTAAATVIAPAARAAVHVVGSRRMECALPAADLDLVAALPGEVDMAVFPGLVAAALPRADRVREVTGARVPGLRLTVDGLQVDLSLVATGQVPPDAAAARRAELGESAAIALSAVGDADAVRSAVHGYQDAFARLARAVKWWAKARGLDSAPFGGLPGVAWSILAARVIGDGTTGVSVDTPALLQRFFGTWAAWDWREPVMLGATEATDAHAPSPMTILTPSFPERNCTGHVSPGGRDLLVEELYRAWEITETRAGTDAVAWSELLAPPDLHRRHAAWAVVTVSADSSEAFDRVLGRTRGRMLALISALDEAGAGQVHAWPRPFVSGPATASYAIGLGRTPPDSDALQEISKSWLAGLRGVHVTRADVGEVPTLR
jgi:endonuclease/exonuclease/phosphatase family metal-dependent hydrolase/2'-5' RNA ligase/uncharacterized protein (UPF0248 family)